VEQQWVRPPRLRAGDRVAVVAPASVVSEAALAAGVERLRSWGLEVAVGAHVLDRDATLTYLAGTDADRAADFQQAWCDPDIAAVFAARGGYGTLRILDLLDWAALAAAGPKIFVGSSDLTALHRVLGPRLRLVTYFGPMVATTAFGEDGTAAERLRLMLFGDGATRLTGEPLVAGSVRGPLTGGTLSLLVSGLGVRDVPPPPDGAIVLLEDVNEEPYRVDHFLTHLLRAGWFDRAAGIALGSWERCGNPADLYAVLTDRLAPLGLPTACRLDVGHCPGAATVPLGAAVTLDTGALDTGALDTGTLDTRNLDTGARAPGEFTAGEPVRRR
jgi:muramoyltetrapeptide carboxypeptidase